MRNFDYAQINSHDWADHLSYLSDEGKETLTVPIYWSHHETLPGAPDFHSKSRLKLEKLLALAQSKKVSLELKVGFFDAHRSFPTWTRTLPHQALIPDWSLSQRVSDWRFTKVPSFQNNELKAAFFSFVREVLTLASLYREPEGTLKDVRFDFGVMGSEAVVFDSLLIQKHFESRYGSLEKMNHAFQTSFNQFDSLGKQIGFKTILDKRPWLACWEFKELRKKLYFSDFEKLQSLFQEFRFHFKDAKQSSAEVSQHQFVFDDTALEVAPQGEGFLPVAPQGELNQQILNGFQITELIKLELCRKGFSFSPLSQWLQPVKAARLVVVCTKYCSAEAKSKILEAHSCGSEIHFPFDKPSWDENLAHLSWPHERISQGGGLHEFI